MSDFAVPPAPQAFVNWVWHALLGIFAIGFLAWAAAVWHATTLVQQQQEQLKALTDRVNHLENELAEHRALGMHSEAGRLHEREMQALSDIQRRDAELEARMSRLEDRMNGRH